MYIIVKCMLNVYYCINVKCIFFTQISVDEPVPDYFNVKWSKVSQTNKANYHEATKHYLNKLPI